MCPITDEALFMLWFLKKNVACMFLLTISFANDVELLFFFVVVVDVGVVLINYHDNNNMTWNMKNMLDTCCFFPSHSSVVPSSR